jgi:hypothetical protein
MGGYDFLAAVTWGEDNKLVLSSTFGYSHYLKHLLAVFLDCVFSSIQGSMGRPLSRFQPRMM